MNKRTISTQIAIYIAFTTLGFAAADKNDIRASEKPSERLDKEKLQKACMTITPIKTRPEIHLDPGSPNFYPNGHTFFSWLIEEAKKNFFEQMEPCLNSGKSSYAGDILLRYFIYKNLISKYTDTGKIKDISYFYNSNAYYNYISNIIFNSDEELHLKLNDISENIQHSRRYEKDLPEHKEIHFIGDVFESTFHQLYTLYGYEKTKIFSELLTCKTNLAERYIEYKNLCAPRISRTKFLNDIQDPGSLTSKKMLTFEPKTPVKNESEENCKSKSQVKELIEEYLSSQESLSRELISQEDIICSNQSTASRKRRRREHSSSQDILSQGSWKRIRSGDKSMHSIEIEDIYARKIDEKKRKTKDYLQDLTVKNFMEIEIEIAESYLEFYLLFKLSDNNDQDTYEDFFQSRTSQKKMNTEKVAQLFISPKNSTGDHFLDAYLGLTAFKELDDEFELEKCVNFINDTIVQYYDRLKKNEFKKTQDKLKSIIKQDKVKPSKNPFSDLSCGSDSDENSS